MAKDLISSFLPTAEVFPSRPLTLQIGATFGPFYVNLYSTRPVLIGTFTPNPSTDVLTLNAHGLSNGTMVQVSKLTRLTDGLDSGELYFVINATTDTLQLSKTRGGAVVDLKSTDQSQLYKTGTPYNLTDHKVWAWVKHQVTDPDNDLVLDLSPSITGAAYGFGYDWQITFTKTKTQTFSMTPASHVWSLLLQFPDGTRSLLVDNSRFVISLPSTHPNLIS